MSGPASAVLDALLAHDKATERLRALLTSAEAFDIDAAQLEVERTWLEYRAASDRWMELATEHACGSCSHTECACGCRVCRASHLVKREPCQCGSCSRHRRDREARA